MSTRKLLESFLNKDMIAAKKIFEEVMADRLRNLVDTKKMEVGFKMTNGRQL